jgi:hypothetical protein
MEANGSAAQGAPKMPPPARHTRAVNWLRTQAVNVLRHAEALRPFRRDEFGTGPAGPTDAHVKAANDLLAALRVRLMRRTRAVEAASAAARREPTTANLQRLLRLKERAHSSVQASERVWDFYFELFGQRQSVFGTWLLSCDRIALDSYQHAYIGLGTARSIPTPPPFSYMRTGFSPATFRRRIPLRRLGLQLNPFPLIQLPYHRLVNPWTLGAVLHEVCHNLQNDLGLAKLVPLRLGRVLTQAGLGRKVAATWVRWNRETFADLGGLLLGGPAVAASLMDIIGRSPQSALGYSPTGPHPTPYLRAFLSFELLRRLGFDDHYKQYRRLWERLYPDPRAGSIPRPVLETFAEAKRLVVDAICFRPFKPLGNKPLAEVIQFGAKEQVMIEEAAGRLASGTDPGIVPERFLIGASRVALSRQLAEPEAITQAFYRELARR